jgi:hypothetical protein
MNISEAIDYRKNEPSFPIIFLMCFLVFLDWIGEYSHKGTENV